MIALSLGVGFVVMAFLGVATDKPLTAFDAFMAVGVSSIIAGVSDLVDNFGHSK